MPDTIDTSSYRQPQQPSVMDRFSSAAGVANLLTQNRLLGLEAGGLSGEAAAFADARKPDGSIDFNRLLGDSPMAGPYAGEVAAASQNLQSTAMDIAAKGAQALKARWFARVNSGAADDYQGYVTDAANMVADGELPASTAAAMVRSVPHDANALKDFGLQMGIGSMSPESQGNVVDGPPIPGTNQPTKITAGQAAALALGGRAGSRSPGAGSGATLAPADTAAAAPPAGPAIGFPSAPAPGVLKAAEDTAEASAAQLGQDRAQATKFTQASYPLSKAIPLLEALGPTGTGPGSETWNELKTFAQSWGFPLGDKDRTQAYNQVRKFLNQQVTSNGDTSSNDKLAASFASNPNLSLDQASNVVLAKSMLSLQRLKQAQVLAFGQTGLGPDQYAKWASTWNTGQDVRAFGWDLMTPAERAKVWGSLPPNDPKNPNDPASPRNRFKQSVELAKGLNLFGAPSNAQ
jgi:hypothetical protein